MIVLHLNACPPGIRGDVTKWMMEITTGVYVGNLSRRTREALWMRVCKHAGKGSAVMVCSAQNEQGFVYYVYNTSWKPTDFDGVTLMCRPLPARNEDLATKKTKSGQTQEKPEQCGDQSEDEGKSRRRRANRTNNSPQTKARSIDSADNTAKGSTTRGRRVQQPLPYMPWPDGNPLPKDFVVMDTETTGLNPEQGFLIEMACARVRDGMIREEFQRLVRCDSPLPKTIQELTGITESMLENGGVSPEQALSELFEFIGTDWIIGHHVAFDVRFLQATCSRLMRAPPMFRAIDTVILARKACEDKTENYRLETLAKHFGIAEKQTHRALPDARITAQLYL